jgi:hypothetical protein
MEASLPYVSENKFMLLAILSRGRSSFVRPLMQNMSISRPGKYQENTYENISYRLILYRGDGPCES